MPGPGADLPGGISCLVKTTKPRIVVLVGYHCELSRKYVPS